MSCFLTYKGQQFLSEQELLAALDNITTSAPAVSVDNIQAELEEVSRLLPPSIALEIHDDYLNLLDNGARVVGMFTNGLIRMSKYAGKGDVYHEAFHAVFRTLAEQSEVLGVLNEAKENLVKYTEEDIKYYQEMHDITRAEAIDLFYEEQLADEFARYMLNPQAYEFNKSETKKKSLFQRLLAWLGFSKKAGKIERMFKGISSGRYATATARVSQGEAAKALTPVDNLSRFYNMSTTGFISPQANIGKLRPAAKKLGYTVKTATSGSYYFVSDSTGRMYKPSKAAYKTSMGEMGGITMKRKKKKSAAKEAVAETTTEATPEVEVEEQGIPKAKGPEFIRQITMDTTVPFSDEEKIEVTTALAYKVLDMAKGDITNLAGLNFSEIFDKFITQRKRKARQLQREGGPYGSILAQNIRNVEENKDYFKQEVFDLSLIHI